jgi:ABC-type dipeptide/oligopeptide/nickel transport system permease component
MPRRLWQLLALLAFVLPLPIVFGVWLGLQAALYQKRFAADAGRTASLVEKALFDMADWQMITLPAAALASAVVCWSIALGCLRMSKQSVPQG